MASHPDVNLTAPPCHRPRGGDNGFANVFDVFAIFSGNAGAKKNLEGGDLVAAVVSSTKSSKSELSSRFLSHLKFLEVCTGEGGRAIGKLWVFGPPWREDYRREVRKLSHTGPQGVGGF